MREIERQGRQGCSLVVGRRCSKRRVVGHHAWQTRGRCGGIRRMETAGSRPLVRSASEVGAPWGGRPAETYPQAEPKGATLKSPVLFGEFLRLSVFAVRAFAKRASLPEFPSGGLHIGALALEIVVDRTPEAGIDDVVRRVGGVGQIAACELMLALGAGLDAGEPMSDRVFDRLVIADLEMQERMVLGRAPMTAEQRAVADEVDRPGDEAAPALRHDQDGLLRHGLPDE